MLIETKDIERIARKLGSEIANAEAQAAITKGVAYAPTPGNIYAAINAGGLFFEDDTEPRVICECVPLSKTEIGVKHLWGPSAVRDQKMYELALALQAKGFTTVRFRADNAYGQAAKSAMGVSASTDAKGETSISLAVAVANWKAKGLK